jgi:molybdenum cofactor guanylyltransferase
MTVVKINGLILSGGKSLRMGQDKSLITYHGKPQREYLFGILSKCCDAVFTSCKSTQDVPAKLNPLPDIFEQNSPLNGILSAFRHTPSVAWFSVPVDMPNIDGAVLKYLLDHRDEKKLATCFYDSDGKHPEPLLTLWEPASAALLEKHYQSGNVGARSFLMQHDINIIKAPSEKIYQNINTREELFRFRGENL